MLKRIVADTSVDIQYEVIVRPNVHFLMHTRFMLAYFIFLNI